jgi:peptide deformylase
MRDGPNKKMTIQGDESIRTVDPTDLVCPESPLRRASTPVISFGQDIRILASRMATVLLQSPHGTGISAVQLDVPLRVVVLNHARTPSGEVVLVNPIPVRISGRRIARREGCLSLPNYSGEVTRRNKVSVMACTAEGKQFEYSVVGYQATVLQHELDHLDGILYWDLMTAGQPHLRETL